jgi:hypothetical protein
MAASLGVNVEEWVGLWISESVRGLLRFSPCELLLLEAGSWGTRTIREPRGRGTSAVGSRYQKTVADKAGWEDLSVCCSEMQSVWFSDSATVTCNYYQKVFNKSNYQSMPLVWSLHTIVTVFIKSDWTSWTRYWTFGFHKMLGNSSVAAQLAASQEGLSSMELVS